MGSNVKERDDRRSDAVLDDTDGMSIQVQYDPDAPLISVAVLCYKNRNLLNGMLKSILEQDYPRIQLIVSDDGSGDFDIEDVSTYIDANRGENIEQVIVRKNETNLGTVQHIIGVLSQVTADYIVFTAADDRFVGSNVLSTYVRKFEQKPKQLWLVARCNVLTPDYKKSLYVTPTEEDALFFEREDSLRLFSRWSRRGMAVPCSMAFRREAFTAVGGIDPEYHYLEDWPLVLKLLRAGYAPIYVPQITAVHSAGGVTNSNKRYGVGVRERFYRDKQLIFNKEVEPYLDLLTAEDLKAYNLYQKEIMARNYFLDITWVRASKVGKLKLLLKPQQFWWVAEKAFAKYKHFFRRKRMFIAAQLLLLLSMPMYLLGKMMPIYGLFQCVSILDIALSILILCTAIVSFPLKFIFGRKEKIRRELVN